MKTKSTCTTRIHSIPAMRLEAFAAKHSLDIVVRERPRPKDSPNRYHASFPNVEIKGDGILTSTFGDGRTPFKAIRAYAKELSLQPLVIDAYRNTRKELTAPRLT